MHIKKLSTLFVFIFLAAVSFAQKKEAAPDNLLFLLRNPQHVTQALKTVQQLQSNAAASKTIRPGNVVIIVCGEAIKEFTGSTPNESVTEARRLGVNLYGCGLSLKKFELSQSDLMPGMQYVENGLIKAFELQKAGYLSVEL